MHIIQQEPYCEAFSPNSQMGVACCMESTVHDDPVEQAVAKLRLFYFAPGPYEVHHLCTV
jgi:hypothetical protein